jgi:hypothetical protein
VRIATALLLALGLLCLVMADEGFIDFDGSTVAAHRG